MKDLAIVIVITLAICFVIKLCWLEDMANLCAKNDNITCTIGPSVLPN